MAKIYYLQSNDGMILETSNPDWYEGYKKLMQKEGAALHKQQAKNALLNILTPGDKVFTILRNVSASGMQRCISLLVIKDNKPVCLDYNASVLLGYKRSDKHTGLIVSGCGMDMGFDLVYNLGCALWPAGTPNPHGTRNGEPDSDGGYALKQQWI